MTLNTTRTVHYAAVRQSDLHSYAVRGDCHDWWQVGRTLSRSILGQLGGLQPDRKARPSDGFFIPVNYRGGFSTDDNWLAGWTAAMNTVIDGVSSECGS